jgi:type II secretory pathway predicted ATPase ExeA
MYLSFYNLKVKPFQMSTDPDFLWPGKQHKEALATLKYAVRENKGVLALTGEVGTGKTTLINALVQDLEDDKVAATICDPSFDVLEFFNVVSAAFKMGKTFESKGQFINYFRQFLLKAYGRKQRVLLIIDEAQGINSETLEEIRLLSNLEEDHIRLLNIFFVGQNEFIDILQEYKNRALNQRIAIRYHLEPLKLSETEAYVRHRLHVGGTEAPIFSPGAIDEIFAFSGGYPRLINIISDHALLRGYLLELDTIHENTIRECREELLVSKKSSNYPDHDQKITSPKAEVGVPEGGLEISEKDWGFSDNGQRFLGQDTDIIVSEDSPKPVKRRTVPMAIGVVLLAAVGVATGYVYFQDGTNTVKSRIFSFLKLKDAPRSMKVPPSEKKSLILPPVPEKSEVSTKVEGEKNGESRFFTVPPPEPESLEKAAPKKGKPLDAVPPPRFAGESPRPSASEKTDTPVVLAPGSGTGETVKAAIPTEDKRFASASTPAKPLVEPKTSETARQDYGKPTAVKPAPKSGWTQSDTSGKDLTAANDLSEEKGSSAVSSKIQATGPTAFSSAISPERTVISQGDTTVTHQMVTQEKEPSAVTMPDKKNSAVQSDGRAVSLNQPVGGPESGSERTFGLNNLQDRLKTFLNGYCRTYERKDLEAFSSFFASDAVEKDKPFKSWAPQYRQNFNKIDSMIYNIELERFATQDKTGEVRIEGTFQVRAKLSGSKKWRKSSGRISMVLEPYKDSFRVKQLNY